MNELFIGSGKNIKIFTLGEIVIIFDLAEQDNVPWYRRSFAYQITEDIRKNIIFNLSFVDFHFQDMNKTKTFFNITLLPFSIYFGFT